MDAASPSLPPAVTKAEADALARILPRYVRPLPRYTSYPTAPVWSDAFGSAAYRDALARVAGDVSVYVHVPFCRSLCHFCACNRIITRDPALPERYLEDLEREVARVHRLLAAGAGSGAAQVHLGGGTPTHLSPAGLERLMRIVDDAFAIRSDAEVSIEVDPRVTTPDHVQAIAACGFDRVSLGVQDFDARVQQAIHRIQSVALTAELVDALRAVGISSVGFDLIYGLPFQTRSSLERTLDAVLDIAPDRIALYAYAHVTWVAKQQRGFERHDLPTPGERLTLMLGAIRRLLEAGYVHVGLDHFARPDDALARARNEGSLHRNFMGYTTRAGLDLVGFGPSAISEVGGAYAQNERTLEGWGGALARGGLATLRGHLRSEDDEQRHFVIERILCHGSVDASAFTERFGRRFANRFSDELEVLAAMEEDGLLATTADGSFSLSLAGRLLARNVASVFDAYLPPDAAADGAPRFSQSV